VAYINKNKRAA